MSNKENLRINAILTRWYNENKRDLPWRHTTDPYLIWISEVILQQTRVDQGLSYYNRFIGRFPTVGSLAEAAEDEVLKLWQGLGYYSRARNLHATAKMIMDKFGGVFPVKYEDVLSLKGVGEYTAAAIVSFSYNQPYATVDGNVYRVLSRIFAIGTPINSGKGQKEFKELAQSLIRIDEPGLHNQAIMEFGALQCIPVSPDCPVCPAASMCLAYAANSVGSYPVKEGKQKVRNRYFNYFDIRHDGYIYLQKRIAKDIWQNLYELPLVETDAELLPEDLTANEEVKKMFGPGDNVQIKHVAQFKHILSHQRIYATFYRVTVDNISLSGDYIKVKAEDADKYPVSRLVHKYFETG